MSQLLISTLFLAAAHDLTARNDIEDAVIVGSFRGQPATQLLALDSSPPTILTLIPGPNVAVFTHDEERESLVRKCVLRGMVQAACIPDSNTIISLDRESMALHFFDYSGASLRKPVPWPSGLAHSLRVSRDGSFAVAQTSHRVEHGFENRVVSIDLKSLRITVGPIGFDPDISADGQRVLFLGAVREGSPNVIKCMDPSLRKLIWEKSIRRRVFRPRFIGDRKRRVVAMERIGNFQRRIVDLSIDKNESHSFDVGQEDDDWWPESLDRGAVIAHMRSNPSSRGANSKCRMGSLLLRSAFRSGDVLAAFPTRDFSNQFAVSPDGRSLAWIGYENRYSCRLQIHLLQSD